MYFQQIISAVDYCHRFKIAHRDLKPENLLLDRDNNIKVADFGMAAWEGGMDMLETSCGSPHYASPEVVQGKAYKGFTSDIWSCGVILYALLVGRLPFDDENIRVLLDKVKRAKFVMPTDIPLAAQDLIARMLQKDVDNRITMKEILVHPWFTCLPPKPLRSPVVAPPSLEMVYRPVETASEIDPDIFANLRTLWHGAPDDQIICSLLSKEYVSFSFINSLLTLYLGAPGKKPYTLSYFNTELEGLRTTTVMRGNLLHWRIREPPLRSRNLYRLNPFNHCCLPRPGTILRPVFK